MRGMKACKHRQEGDEFLRATAEDITCKEYKIHILSIDFINQVRNKGSVIAPRSDMGIAELEDAETLERLGHLGRIDSDMIHYDIMACRDNAPPHYAESEESRGQGDNRRISIGRMTNSAT